MAKRTCHGRWLAVTALIYLSFSAAIAAATESKPSLPFPSWLKLLSQHNTLQEFDDELTTLGRQLSHNNKKKKTDAPTIGPSFMPSASPSSLPSSLPIKSPIMASSNIPPDMPNVSPTNAPSTTPSKAPTKSTISDPTASPIASPIASSTPLPTVVPTASPSTAPTSEPTAIPSFVPSSEPSSAPIPLVNIDAQLINPQSPTAFTSSSPSKTPTKLGGETETEVISRTVPLEPFQVSLTFLANTDTSSLDLKTIVKVTEEHLRQHVQESLDENIIVKRVDLTLIQSQNRRLRRRLEQVESLTFQGEATLDTPLSIFNVIVLPSTSDLGKVQRDAFSSTNGKDEYLQSLKDSYDSNNGGGGSDVIRDTTGVQVTFSPDLASDSTGDTAGAQGADIDGGGSPIGIIAAVAGVAGLLLLGVLFFLHRRKKNIGCGKSVGESSKSSTKASKKSRELLAAQRSPSTSSNQTGDMNNSSTRDFEMNPDVDLRSNVTGDDFSLDAPSIKDSNISLSEAIGIQTMESQNGGLYMWNSDGTKMLYTAAHDDGGNDDANEALPSQVRPMGDASVVSTFDDEFSVDNNGSNSNLHQRVGSSGTAGDGSVWTYDRVGNATSVDRNLSSGSIQKYDVVISPVSTFEYDADNVGVGGQEEEGEGIELGIDGSSISVLGTTSPQEKTTTHEEEGESEDEFQPDTRILRSNTREDDDATEWTCDQLSTGSDIIASLTRTVSGVIGDGGSTTPVGVGRKNSTSSSVIDYPSPDSVPYIPDEINGDQAAMDAMVMSKWIAPPVEENNQNNSVLIPSRAIPATPDNNSNRNEPTNVTPPSIAVQQETWKPADDDYDSDVPFDEMVHHRSKSNEPQRRNTPNNINHITTLQNTRHNIQPTYRSNNNQYSDDEHSDSSGSEVLDDLQNLSSFLKERRLQRSQEIERKEARNGRFISSNNESGGMRTYNGRRSRR